MGIADRPDGSLPLALRQLEDAVHALCGPQSRFIEHKLVYVPSRYLQLRDAVDGEQSHAGAGGGLKSRPPLWLDAFDQLAEIDLAVECWQPCFEGVPPTVGRLHCLQARKWRPQDRHQIEAITAVLMEWVTAIDGLLDPEPSAFLMAPAPGTGPAACTSCGATWVRRIHSGERVRQPALRVTKDGCRCQCCHTAWQPGQLRILAAALGYPLPQGCLE